MNGRAEEERTYEGGARAKVVHEEQGGEAEGDDHEEQEQGAAKRRRPLGPIRHHGHFSGLTGRACTIPGKHHADRFPFFRRMH